MKIPKKRNLIKEPSITCITFDMLTYQNVNINQTYNLREFGEDTKIQKCQLCMKILKKRNKINGHFITWRHI